MNDLASNTRLPMGRIALIWLGFVGFLLAVHAKDIAQINFLDPDDALRLVQVRDLLSGQSWFDLHQYRINPGSSPVMHWSRIVDVPIAAAILLFRPLLGQALAEQIAIVLVPMLTFGAIMAVIGRIAFRALDRSSMIFACIACGFSTLLIAQVQPLRIDHHAWQIFFVVLALGTLLGRRPHVNGAIAGLAMATGLSISLEVLPFAAAFGAVLLLRWMRDPAQRWAFANYLASLAAGLVAWFGLTRAGDLTNYCDVVSPAYLALFSVVGLASLGIAARFTKATLPAIALLGLAGLAGLGLLLLLAPQCSNGPFGNLDPLVRQYWYMNVLEGRPFWSQGFARAIPPVLQGFLSLLILFHLWRKSDGALKSWWLDYLLFFGASLVCGLLVWRSMAFVGALSAVPLGWLLRRLAIRFRTVEQALAKTAIGVLGLFVVLPFTPVIVARAMIAPFVSEQAETTAKQSSCDLRNSASKLDHLAPTTIFAPIDIGPDLLERSHHSIVATGHHRAQLAIRDVIAAFIGPEAQAHQIIARHSAHYLVICTDLTETQLSSKIAPNGFMAQVRAGKAPAWLKPVPLDTPATFKVWQVVG